MKDKRNYDNAELEVIKLKARDVVTTSTDIGDGNDRDDDGWTSVDGSWA